MSAQHSKRRGILCVLSVVITVQRYAGLCINYFCYGGEKRIKSRLLVAFVTLGCQCQGSNGDAHSI